MHWVYVSRQPAEAAAAEETGGDVESESPSQHRQHSHVHPLSSHSLTSSTWPNDITSGVHEATEDLLTVTG